MRLRKLQKQFNSIKKRAYFKGLIISKDLRQRFDKTNYFEKRIAFIVGCQRSGTTLLYELFQKDRNAKVYPEFSRLSDPVDYERLRLKPLDEVKRIFERQNVPFIISKPLVETQNADKLLNYFPFSKMIWMYRDYKSVANSNIKHFGINNGIKDLLPIVNNEKWNWRSENVSEYTQSIVKRYFAMDMNPYDAAALFWFARNRLFYELSLEGNKRVYMCKYEDLVKSPLNEMKQLYKFIDVPFPRNRIVEGVHTEAVERGAAISLSPEIELLCYELYQKLEDSYLGRNVDLHVA